MLAIGIVMSIEADLRVEYYYDSHPTDEDLMGQTALHVAAVNYVWDVLKRMYRPLGWFVAIDLNIYRTPDPLEYPLAPDIAVHKGVKRWTDPRDAPKSWPLALPGHPPPQVVIEIAMDNPMGDATEVDFIPDGCALMGVKECYLFDPRPDRPPGSVPLRGWRRGPGGAEEMAADAHGRLWSDELESWLEPDEEFLRFYDAQGRLRLTGEEAERKEKEAERREKEAERAQSERLRALLRSHGIDPDA